MAVRRTAIPRLLLGDDTVLADAELLEKHGIAQVVCIGKEAPACTVPCSSMTLGDDVGSETFDPPMLGKATERLRQVLMEVSQSSSAKADTDPTDSSDEECGGSGGTRIRVRLTRSGDERWGINWHKTIFKKSHRLVVDDVVEGSLVDSWNTSQPSSLKVRYGDKLARINGVCDYDGTAQQVCAKMRAELQRQEIRALFWRASEAVDDASQTSRNAVLVCAPSSHLALAAGAIVGTAAQYPDDLGVKLPSDDNLKTLLGDALLDLIADQKLDGVLANLAKRSKPSAPSCGENDDAGEKPLDGERSAASSLVAAAEPEETACREQKAPPKWSYRCMKCSTILFHDSNVLPHYEDGELKPSRDWKPKEQEEGEELVTCTSMFVEPMKWMGELEGQTGRLVCGNPACKQKLGQFSWHGLPCSCGQWQSPAFQIHSSRLDCMPFSGYARCAAPRAVFEA